MTRSHGRTDATQYDIVKTLRRLGASVQSLAMVGSGCPDLLVGVRNRNFLIEVKDGSQPPSRRQLRESQEAWKDNWRGRQPTVLTSADDATDWYLTVRGWVGDGEG